MTEIAASVCPLDCPDTCSLSVEVSDGRVTALEGSELNPLTAGFMCAKVRRFPELVYGADRLQHPARRIGPKGEGRFERISWDAALELLCERIEAVRSEHGAEAILPLCYGGSNGSLTDSTLDERLFRRLGAARLARTICAAPSTAAASGLYGRMPGVAFDDYVHAKLIVVWGVNPNASGIHVLPWIKRAREAGARLVVVDPRRTPLAKQADLHLAPRPGTDLPLALATIRELFARGAAADAFLAAHCHAEQLAQLRERAEPWSVARAAEVAGVEASDLERFVALYAETRPAVIRCGWGLERNRNGGSAVAAVLALPAIAGHFSVRGGGYSMSNGGAWDMDLEAAVAAPLTQTRLVNMNQVGRALTDDARIRLVLNYNANPLATFPDQERMRAGLLRDDLFSCVFEQTFTDTARYADLLLPATTFLEHDELRRSYGALICMRSRPVVPAWGEARSNLAVFGELLERLGLSEPADPTTPDQLIEVLLGPERAAELERSGSLTPPCGSHPVQMVDVLPRTPDGKVHLLPRSLEAMAPEGLYAFRPSPQGGGLTLISPATSRAISSTLYQLHEGIVPLELAPADAAARGIQSGDRVRAFNDLGEVLTNALVNEDLRPGVVCLPKGLWAKHTHNGATANALCSDRLADLGGGATFNDARVEVERVG